MDELGTGNTGRRQGAGILTTHSETPQSETEEIPDELENHDCVPASLGIGLAVTPVLADDAVIEGMQDYLMFSGLRIRHHSAAADR